MSKVFEVRRWMVCTVLWGLNPIGQVTNTNWNTSISGYLAFLNGSRLLWRIADKHGNFRWNLVSWNAFIRLTCFMLAVSNNLTHRQRYVLCLIRGQRVSRQSLDFSPKLAINARPFVRTGFPFARVSKIISLAPWIVLPVIHINVSSSSAVRLFSTRTTSGKNRSGESSFKTFEVGRIWIPKGSEHLYSSDIICAQPV